MDIHEEGLWTASSYSEGKTTWEAFSRYLETPHLFLLDIPPNLFCIIPKKAFASDDLDAARQLLEQKIPAANGKQELVRTPT